MRLSIVTISFNQGNFLEQAIQSVVEQDYQDVEYIVVDPGSTDGSREIIEKYRFRISKIIFEPDAGPADGLNKGFAQATGEICGYLNADDYFESGTFQQIAGFFRSRPEVDVLCGAIRIVDGAGKARLRTGIADTFNLKRIIANACWVGQQGTFFRRSAFERTAGFRCENRTCWDGELLVDLALSHSRFEVVHRVFGNFRVHGESISGSGRLNKEYLKDMDRIRRRLEAEGVIVSPLARKFYQLGHKANPIRHLRALLIR